MAIRKLIAIATAGRGISVRFHGDQAYTDGKTIVLPALMDKQAERLALAYAWHESFHVEWTDFTACDEEGIREALMGSPILKGLENVLEDGRIEQQGRKEYPGCHRIINALIQSLVKEENSLFAAPPDEATPPNLLLGYVLNWTRKEVNGYSAIVHLEDWRERLGQAIGEDVVDNIEATLDANRQIASTREALRVAQEILDHLSDEDRSESDSNSGDDAGDQGDSGDSSGSGDDAGDQGGSGGGSDSGDDAGDQGDSGGSSGSGDDAGDQGDSGGSSGSGDDAGDQGDSEGGSGSGSDAGDQDADEVAAQSKNRAAIQSASEDDLEKTDLSDIAQGEINAQASTSGSGSGAGNTVGITATSAVPDRGLYKEIAAPASALATRLRGILQAETLTDTHHPRRSGKLMHRRHLHRIALDDSRIWRRRAQEVDVTGAVHVLLDTSGSMTSERTNLVRYGLAAVRALEQAGGLDVSATTLIDSQHGCTLLKAPHESCVSVSGRFSSITITGSTPMAQAMEAAMPLLRSASGGHRVMVIFTDGQPDCPHAVNELIANNGGVKCVAVILGNHSNCLENMMPSARIGSVRELPKVVTNLVSQAIRRGNHV